MGQATAKGNVQESKQAITRFRVPGFVLDRDDPIVMVSEAVRAVLAEVREPGAARRETGCQDHADRLLAARHVEALPRGTRVVRIGSGTVVTPLALDLLKRLGITVRPGEPGESLDVARGEWAFAISGESGTVHAVRRGMLEDSRAWLEIEPVLDQVTGWLLQAEGRGAMWITPEGARTVWKACRARGVRAAWASEPSEVHRAVQDLGVNLLVVEPDGKSISLMRQLASAFRHAGAPRIPDDLRGEEA